MEAGGSGEAVDRDGFSGVDVVEVAGGSEVVTHSFLHLIGRHGEKTLGAALCTRSIEIVLRSVRALDM